MSLPSGSVLMVQVKERATSCCFSPAVRGKGYIAEKHHENVRNNFIETFERREGGIGKSQAFEAPVGLVPKKRRGIVVVRQGSVLIGRGQGQAREL